MADCYFVGVCEDDTMCTVYDDTAVCEDQEHAVNKIKSKRPSKPDDSRPHRKPRVYLCPECPRRFAYSSALVSHCFVSHSDRDASMTSDSADAMELHSAAYVCPFCGRGFAQSSNMKKHVLTHTGERRFKCSWCVRSFRQSGHLAAHLRLHTGCTPFVCGLCGRRFVQCSNLKKHELVHSGITPYECHVCGKRFVQTSHLRQHSRLHTGERPFICELCGRQFTQSSNLKKHKKTHTNHADHTNHTVHRQLLSDTCADDLDCVEIKPEIDVFQQLEQSPGNPKMEFALEDLIATTPVIGKTECPAIPALVRSIVQPIATSLTRRNIELTEGHAQLN